MRPPTEGSSAHEVSPPMTTVHLSGCLPSRNPTERTTRPVFAVPVPCPVACTRFDPDATSPAPGPSRVWTRGHSAPAESHPLPHPLTMRHT